MPVLAISIKKKGTQTKLRNKKSNSYKFISDFAESNYTMTSHGKFLLIYATQCFPEPYV